MKGVKFGIIAFPDHVAPLHLMMNNYIWIAARTDGAVSFLIKQSWP